MPLTRIQKQQQIEALQRELGSATAIVVAGFTGLKVEQDYELRKQIRAVGGKYRVVKNTLAERAAQGGAAGAVLKDLKGACSIAYTSGDAVALAKALQKYAKDNPGFTFRSGLVEGKALAASEITQLAAMPSKEEIYAKLLFLIQAPAQRLVGTLAAVGRNVAVVVDQGVKHNKFAGGAEAAPAAQ